MAGAPEKSATADPDDIPQSERPELLKRLDARKERHAQRGIVGRVAVVITGVLLVLAGIVMSGPGVPGPGIVVILLGLSFLALEFEKAERLLERAIVAADAAKDRAESASPRQKLVSGILTGLALAAFVVAAVLWDIPLVPVL